MGSLLEHAADKKCCEFLLRVDDDDEDTLELVRAIERSNPWVPIKKIIGKRGNGYGDFHIWINELAKIATGDWLLLWNDDIVMKTDKWDEKILFSFNEKAFPWSRDVIALFPKDNNGIFWLRKAAYDILGQVSGLFAVDVWIYRIFDISECLRRVDIEFEHNNPPEATEGKNQEARDAAYFTWKHLDPIAMREFIADLEKILSYMDKKKLESVWQNLPDKSGWYIWRGPLEKHPNLAYPFTVHVDEEPNVAWKVTSTSKGHETMSFEIYGNGAVRLGDGSWFYDGLPRWCYLGK